MFYDIHKSKRQLKTYLENLNQSSAKLLSKNIQSDLYSLNYTNIKNTIDSFANSHLKCNKTNQNYATIFLETSLKNISLGV
jgi:hypothetical protein